MINNLFSTLIFNSKYILVIVLVTISIILFFTGIVVRNIEAQLTINQKIYDSNLSISEKTYSLKVENILLNNNKLNNIEADLNNKLNVFKENTKRKINHLVGKEKDRNEKIKTIITLIKTQIEADKASMSIIRGDSKQTPSDSYPSKELYHVLTMADEVLEKNNLSAYNTIEESTVSEEINKNLVHGTALATSASKFISSKDQLSLSYMVNKSEIWNMYIYISLIFLMFSFIFSFYIIKYEVALKK